MLNHLGSLREQGKFIDGDVHVQTSGSNSVCLCRRIEV